MTCEELEILVKKYEILKTETQIIEIKSAHEGCPTRLYDTLSSFSNQDDGGTVIFGVDEKSGFLLVGVCDPHDLQKKVTEQCNQMIPVVRPVFTIAEIAGKQFVSAEIPAVDISERPCFYGGKGRLKGACVRVGDADEFMTEYEIYSYESYRKKYQDDVRIAERAAFDVLDQAAISEYIYKLKENKPNLSQLHDARIYELMSLTIGGKSTLASVLLFSPYPQAYYPQLCIIATSVPGTEMGDVGADGERFLDNKRIEGSIPQMLENAITFVRNNMKTKTKIDKTTGVRTDVTDYPITAVREAILNALIHRDYSIHTEGKPIQVTMYDDRMEIISPGGLYGRLGIDQLGKVQPDTRNPVLATALETLGKTENRYSGIPTIYKAMRENNLSDPVFADERGSFIVRLYKTQRGAAEKNYSEYKSLVAFCAIPRSRKEISEYLGLSSMTYAISRHVAPLIEQGVIKMTIPERPSSSKQRFVVVQ